MTTTHPDDRPTEWSARQRRMSWIGFVTVAVAVLVAASVASARPATASDSDIAQRALHHEELIAECMQAKGFEYVVVMPSDVLLEAEMVRAEAAGEDIADALARFPVPPNPNDVIVAALSGDEARRYEVAYWGDDESEGCYASTVETAWGTIPEDLPTEIEQAGEFADAQLAADPRVAAAERELVACMADAGYEVADYQGFLKLRTTYVGELAERFDLPDLATPGGGIGPDEPHYNEVTELLEQFEAATSRCEGAYLEIVEPISNEYLDQAWAEAGR